VNAELGSECVFFVLCSHLSLSLRHGTQHVKEVVQGNATVASILLHQRHSIGHAVHETRAHSNKSQENELLRMRSAYLMLQPMRCSPVFMSEAETPALDDLILIWSTPFTY